MGAHAVALLQIGGERICRPKYLVAAKNDQRHEPQAGHRSECFEVLPKSAAHFRRSGRDAACGAASLAMANRATAAVASSASIKPRPPSRMPKKRPCSEACANSLTPLIREAQNVSPAAKPQPMKIQRSAAGPG